MAIRKQIFIVDDDLQNRKGFYVGALSEWYDLSFTENADNLFYDIKNSKADLYIIDLDLTGFNNPRSNTPLTADDVMGEIGKMKPIIILSGTYKQLMDKGRLTPFITFSAEEGYNICSFFTLDEIIKAAKNESSAEREALRAKIDFAIEKNRKPYDFGVVCALEEELEPFMEKAVAESISIGQISGVKFKRAILKTEKGKELRFVAAFSTNMGIADAGVIASTFVTKLGIETIYMIGVCGGREKGGVSIGDIIIPKESVAFQRGKLTKDGFSPDIQSAKPKEGGMILYDKSKGLLDSLFYAYTMKMAKEQKKSLSLEAPKVVYDVIACADYVIDKEGELDKIADMVSHRKLCGVDMESYAIFRVGEVHDVNTMVIKSVMDLTEKKSDEYKSYAAYIAANYLYQLLFKEVISFS